ncbi:MAG: hypothetical protein IT262_13475 [Saprospiraceae bacterium]|nr:hypothetical protein [Saprospiraceae bacterium]
MKNFFEFFGFLSAAGVSAVLIFLFIGKKEGLKNVDKDRLVSGYNITDSDMPAEPQAIAMRPSKGKTSAKKEKIVRDIEPEQSAAEKLKYLYDDAEFVASTAKQWKSAVKDASEEYNIKPQVLMAHVLVQAYAGSYSRSQLNRDAAQHAGERVKPLSAVLKTYPYGWSMQKVMQQYDLLRYFPEEMPTASAAIRMAPEKKMSAKGGETKSAKPAAKSLTPQASAVEDGFRNMVAKENGFSSWAGLQRLADPDTKAAAQKRVKTLMMASRIK